MAVSGAISTTVDDPISATLGEVPRPIAVKLDTLVPANATEEYEYLLHGCINANQRESLLTKLRGMTGGDKEMDFWEHQLTFDMRPLANYQLQMRRVLGKEFTAPPVEQRPYPHPTSWHLKYFGVPEPNERALVRKVLSVFMKVDDPMSWFKAHGLHSVTGGELAVAGSLFVVDDIKVTVMRLFKVTTPGSVHQHEAIFPQTFLVELSIQRPANDNGEVAIDKLYKVAQQLRPICVLSKYNYDQ